MSRRVSSHVVSSSHIMDLQRRRGMCDHLEPLDPPAYLALHWTRATSTCQQAENQDADPFPCPTATRPSARYAQAHA